MEKNLERCKDNPSLEPTWSHILPGGYHYSPLYHDGVTYRFVASTNEGIFGFTIPEGKGQAPSIILLSTFFSSQNQCIPGLYKAFVPCNVDHNGMRIGYNWGSNNAGSAIMSYCRGELKPARYPTGMWQPAFDEESGRFLFHTAHIVVIFDFLDSEFQTLAR